MSADARIHMEASILLLLLCFYNRRAALYQPKEKI